MWGESQDVLQRELVERFRTLQQGVEAQGQRHDVFVGMWRPAMRAMPSI